MMTWSPMGDLAEVDLREDRAGQMQAGTGREAEVTSEAPKLTCRALHAARPLLLPTAE